MLKEEKYNYKEKLDRNDRRRNYTPVVHIRNEHH